MRKVSIYLFTAALLVSGCSDDVAELEPELFVGRWEVTHVAYDGVLQPEWTGTNLIFEQSNTQGGSYSMVDTQYDSIWSSAGKWTKSVNESELILDDNWPVLFDCKENELTIVRYIPWTKQSTCDENGICLLIVTGYWEFRFRRER